jgi:putative transposase
MKKSRFSDEQIIGFLKQAESGTPVKERCRKNGVNNWTFYRWRSKFAGMAVPEARRLRELEEENRRLNEHLFVTMDEARAELEKWRVDYNTARPHSGLGKLTPEEFAQKHRVSNPANPESVHLSVA